MRKNIVAGNWKMNMVNDQAKELALSVVENSDTVSCQLIIIPPFTAISDVQKVINKSNILLGAQNCSQHKSGAFTGEVSADMLTNIGCSHVIIGHSERRAIFGEDNQLLSEKVNHALNSNLIPIYCCGETLQEREAGNHFDVIKRQIEEGVFNLSEDLFGKIVIAYEPVWAIGTGKTASADQAQEIHKFIRSLVLEKYNETIANNISILYGGSVKPDNAKEIFAKPDVDGGLIGGAALKATDFIAIATSF
ncbi:MAG: triose-phosphate isomerase [Bacteroidales bacterium]|nr:triose-phosphate isomerase [Bacteroidales bacterium]